MPQIFNVVRCFSCSTFQVHQVKKAKKWLCKVCGAKQSMIKVYGQGTGAECRQHVQKLNYLRRDVDEKEYQMAIDKEFLDVPKEPDSNNPFTSGANGFRKLSSSFQSSSSSSSSSKWSKFLPCEDEAETSQLDDVDCVEECNQEKKIENSLTFPYQEKRKNPFSDVYFRDSLTNSGNLMKKPRTVIKNNFQLSSINSEKSNNWSHSVSVESWNRGTNLITRRQPVPFENGNEIMSDESRKTLQNETDLLKTRKNLSTSLTFRSSLSMVNSQSCLSGFCDEGNNFPGQDLTADLSNVESRHSKEENVFKKDFIESGCSKSLDYENGLKNPQNGSTKKVLTIETWLHRKNNSDNGLSSRVNKKKMDVDCQILPLSCKSSSNTQNKIIESNFPISNNLDKSNSAINSTESNYLKNIFQLDESEVDLNF